MSHIPVLTIALAFLAYGLVSRRLKGTVLTGPLLFAGFGWLVGSAALGLVPLETTSAALHVLAEITLILVLFTDAANIDLRQLRRDHNIPLRMLAIGMPLSIVLGTFVLLAVFPIFSLWEAALVATILAPTDAALGQAVVTNRLVPVRIRQALNVESGLNDGIALPFVLIFASLASAMESSTHVSTWLVFALEQVTLGPLAGIFVGYAGARLVALCHRNKWMSMSAEGLIALALSFSAFALAELIHGNGFIAAFIAGLTFGNTLGRQCAYVREFAESEGLILVLLTFLAFGSAMLPMAVNEAQPLYVLFALFALTAIRMVPVWISLLGTAVKPFTTAFLGWFGPRGLASILFVLLVLRDFSLPHQEEILLITIVSVALSILLHGITAGPAARWHGARTQLMGKCAENRAVSEEPFTESA